MITTTIKKATISTTYDGKLTDKTTYDDDGNIINAVVVITPYQYAQRNKPYCIRPQNKYDADNKLLFDADKIGGTHIDDAKLQYIYNKAHDLTEYRRSDAIKIRRRIEAINTPYDDVRNYETEVRRKYETSFLDDDAKTYIDDKTYVFKPKKHTHTHNRFCAVCAVDTMFGIHSTTAYFTTDTNLIDYMRIVDYIDDIDDDGVTVIGQKQIVRHTPYVVCLKCFDAIRLNRYGYYYDDAKQKHNGNSITPIELRAHKL